MKTVLWRVLVRGRALAALLILLVPLSAQSQSIRIATEGFYPPFNYFDDAGDLVGFDVDIAQALCAEMATPCQIVQNDWDGLIPGLAADEYDAIVASMSITPEREAEVAFTLPYYSNMLAFVSRRGRSFEISPEGLNGRSVGVQRNTVSADYLEETYGSSVDAMAFDTQASALEALANGDIDLVLGDNLPAYAWLQTDVGKAHEFVGEFVDIDDRIGIAVRKDDQALLDQLNTALIAIIENGMYQEINARYFPFSIYF